MSNKFIDVLTDFFSEATDLCGSEGLFQSLFYHHLRTYFQKENILREYSVSQGKIDFVIIDDEAAIAIEFKGGANSNRNSLESMMNNDNSKKQKGFIHDLEKLKKFKTKCKEKEKTIPWLVCLDLNDLGLAFSGSDIQKYSKKAQQYQSHFAYFSQFESDFQTFRNGQKRDNPIERVTQKQATMDPYMVMQNKSFWAEYFSEVTDAEPECAHVGKLYHKFRVAGLKNNQCTSELFLKCNRKSNSPNAYYRPDFALFTDDFNGQFQLFEKGNKENSNDKFKLPCLKVIFEFKGGESFSKKTQVRKKKILLKISINWLKYIHTE